MVLQLGFAANQTAGSDDGLLSLASTDASAVTYLSLTANRDNSAVSELGFDDGQGNPTVQLFSRSLTGENFIQDTTLSGTVSLGAIDGSLQPSGRFGFLGAQATGGTLNGTASVGLELIDPDTETPGGRLSLVELLTKIGPITTTGILTKGSIVITEVASTTGLAVGQTVTGEGIPANTTVTAIDSAGMTVTLTAAAAASSFHSDQPNSPAGTVTPTNLSFSNVFQVVTTPTTSGTASATLPLTFPGFVSSTAVPLAINVADLSDPVGSLSLDTSGMGAFAGLQFLDFSEVVAAFEKIASYLQSYGSFMDAAGQRPLTSALPTVNQDATSLLDYAAKLSAFVAALQTLDISTTQELQEQATELLASYGISASITPSLDTSQPTGPYIIHVGVTFDNGSQQFRFGLGNVQTLVNLGGGAPNLQGVSQFVDDEVSPVSFMSVQASAALNLTLGFDLSDPATPTPFLSNGADLVTYRVLANGSNLNFPASFGKIGLFVKGGSAFLDRDGQPTPSNPATPATITIALAGGQNGAPRLRLKSPHRFHRDARRSGRGEPADQPHAHAAPRAAARDDHHHQPRGRAGRRHRLGRTDPGAQPSPGLQPDPDDQGHAEPDLRRQQASARSPGAAEYPGVPEQLPRGRPAARLGGPVPDAFASSS